MADSISTTKNEEVFSNGANSLEQQQQMHHHRATGSFESTRVMQQIVAPRSFSLKRRQTMGPTPQTHARRHQLITTNALIQRQEVRKQFLEFKQSKNQQQVQKTAAKQNHQTTAIVSTVDMTHEYDPSTLQKEQVSHLDSKQTISLTPGSVSHFKSAQQQPAYLGSDSKQQHATIQQQVLKHDGQEGANRIEEPLLDDSAAHYKTQVGSPRERSEIRIVKKKMAVKIQKATHSRHYPEAKTQQIFAFNEGSSIGDSAARDYAYRTQSSFDTQGPGTTQATQKHIPSLHTTYPAHRNGSVPPLKSEYKNLWDTSLFYPAAVSAKAGFNQLPQQIQEQAQQEQELQRFIQKEREPSPIKPNTSVVINKIFTQIIPTESQLSGPKHDSYESEVKTSSIEYDSTQPYRQPSISITQDKQAATMSYFSAEQQNQASSQGGPDQTQNEFYQTRHSLASSTQREPRLANVQASMFGDKQKYSRRDAAEMQIAPSTEESTLSKRYSRAQTSYSESQRYPEFEGSRTAHQLAQMHPEEAEILLASHARNATFKINMPHSQARMPNYLPNEQIRPKPFVPQRRHVHSYIYPSKFDMLRHEMKSKLKDKLNYQYPQKRSSLVTPNTGQDYHAFASQASVDSFAEYDNSYVEPAHAAQQPPHSRKREHAAPMYRKIGVTQGEAVELTLEHTIPQKALRQTLDRTHEMLKAWKLDQVPRKTTFSQARRFIDPQILYGPRMANFSLIDISNHFKKYNGAPRLEKFSNRPEFFAQTDGAETEEEAYVRRYALLKPPQKEGGENKEQDDVEPEQSFHPDEHRKVERMKPYIKQIIKDMKSHAQIFSLQSH